MANRTDIKEFPDLTDFVCGQVLTEVSLNKMLDAMRALKQNGDTVFSQMAGMDGDRQRVICGFNTSNETSTEIVTSLFSPTVSATIKFENVRWDKYLLEFEFRCIDSDGDTDFVKKTGGAGAYFEQEVTIVYSNGLGNSQTLFNTNDPEFGSFAKNTIHEQCLKGTLSNSPAVGISDIGDLTIVITNNASAGSTIVDGDEFRIANNDKWGGVSRLSLKLHS